MDPDEDFVTITFYLKKLLVLQKSLYMKRNLKRFWLQKNIIKFEKVFSIRVFIAKLLFQKQTFNKKLNSLWNFVSLSNPSNLSLSYAFEILLFF
jgi:hypothetical protein